MPFIEQAVGDAQEQETVPAGRYQLRVDAADPHEKEETGSQSIRARISVLNSPPGIIPSAIFHFVPLVTGNEVDEEKRQNKLRFQARFLYWFGIPHDENGFNDEDFLGAESIQDLAVTEEPYNGEMRNSINLPPVPKNAR